MQPARACMYFFSPLTSRITRARARVCFPPYAKDKHTLQQKTHLANGEESWEKKRIPHLAFAGASLGHLCVYVAMGGYVKIETGL